MRQMQCRVERRENAGHGAADDAHSNSGDPASHSVRSHRVWLLHYESGRWRII